MSLQQSSIINVSEGSKHDSEHLATIIRFSPLFVAVIVGYCIFKILIHLIANKKPFSRMAINIDQKIE